MSEKKFRRIGILTSGGDAPGMNPCFRAITRAIIANGSEAMGIRRGYKGLIDNDKNAEDFVGYINNHLNGSAIDGYTLFNNVGFDALDAVAAKYNIDITEYTVYKVEAQHGICIVVNGRKPDITLSVPYPVEHRSAQRSIGIVGSAIGQIHEQYAVTIHQCTRTHFTVAVVDVR